VDVTLRVSGFFRDAFPEQIALFDSAARAVAALDEPDDQNPVRRRFREAGDDGDVSVFGAMPGAYGAGLQALIDTGAWQSRADLAEAFVAWGRYAYGKGRAGDTVETALRSRLAGIDAVVQAQDNREHDILDSDDYYQFEGGLAAAVEAASGRAPVSLHVDTSRAERPVARTLAEEIARVVRGRAGNPKWIAGVMRHGYKGAFEMAATVDYLFAFAATTNAVADHHFDQLYEAYLEDEAVSAFIAEANAPALQEMAARFSEAIRRGLWSPKKNSVHARLDALLEERP
jgi:cobaltochelatase CobN